MWDFNIGKDVIIYGKNYHIYSCDVFTRTHLMTHGITVPPEVSFQAVSRISLGDN